MKHVSGEFAFENGEVQVVYTNALTIRKPVEIFKVIFYEMTRRQKDHM